MNATFMQRLMLIGAGNMLALAVAAPASAAYRCDAPVFRYDRVACEEAKRSPDALRHYIGRTQMMFNLRYSDYMSQSDLDRYYDRLRAEGPKTDQTEQAQVSDSLPARQ